MKKFLLSLAAVAVAAPSFADTVTFDFEHNDYDLERSATTYIKGGTKVVEEDATIVLNAATSGNGFRLWTDGLRVYKGTTSFTVTVDNAEINGITIAAAKTLGTCTINGDAVAYSNKAYSWTGSAEEATVTVNPTANNAMSSVTITYTPVAGDKKPAELSFNKTEFNVASTLKYFGDAYLSNPNNLTVTYSSSDTSVAEITANGVQINGVGTTVITATSEENDEYMAGKASYTLNVLNPVTSVAQMLALSTGDKILVNAELLVGFVNYSNIFVTDGEDWIQIYNANDYKKGDVIPAGWPATYTLYNGVTPELTDATLPVSTSNAATYLQYPVLGYPTTADVNKVAYFTITFDESTPADKSNFTGTIDGTSVDMRNNYTIESVEAGTYKVLAVVVVYNGKVQLYPVSYEDVTTAVELPSTIDITVNSSAATVSQSYDGDTYNITIKGQAEKGEDTIQVNLATPEGFDGFLLYSAEYGDITILTSTAAKAPAEWVPSSAFPGKKSNAFIATADNYEYEVQGCLYKGDEIASNGMLYFTVKVAKGETVGVNEVEEAAAEAEYYTLDGVKVANPANGIYVKVTGDKTEKVVIK